MDKEYNRTFWEDWSSDETPINAQNLNNIESGIDNNDSRIQTLDLIKFDKVDAQTLVKSITFNRSNGVFLITYFNGATATIDTMLEKLAVNFDFDETTQQMIITLDDGTVKRIDLSAFIVPLEFIDSGTIDFQLLSEGKVTAIIKEGSIQEKHLRPDYLADIRIESASAQTNAANSAASASSADAFSKKSQSYAEGGTGTREGEDTDNAKYYSEQAKQALELLGQAGTVTGVKGDKETSYRKGNVNITSKDIGAYAFNRQDIDLSDISTYDENTWYPIVGRGFDKKPTFFKHIRMTANHGNSGTPSWAAHKDGFYCSLDLLFVGYGWGQADGESLCLNYTARWIDQNDKRWPHGFTEMTQSSSPVIWCRGGGKYIIESDVYDSTWTVHTESYTLYNETVTPVTDGPPFNIRFKSNIYANLKGDADTVDGFHASADAASKNTCVTRDSNGYVFFNKINSNTDNNENPNISQVIVTNGNDNYYRKASLAHLKNALDLTLKTEVLFDGNFVMSPKNEATTRYDLQIGGAYSDYKFFTVRLTDSISNAWHSFMVPAQGTTPSTHSAYFPIIGYDKSDNVFFITGISIVHAPAMLRFGIHKIAGNVDGFSFSSIDYMTGDFENVATPISGITFTVKEVVGIA